MRLRVDHTGTAVDVHVIDDGVGMSDEQRRQAFAPFWQGPHRHANGSSGLGLAIVDQLVRTSHGTIALEPSASGGIDAVVRFSHATD